MMRVAIYTRVLTADGQQSIYDSFVISLQPLGRTTLLPRRFRYPALVIAPQA